ncbi:putative transmembrane protein, partial [Trifolium medium]|nr:putative transmembrane protein [Trifolium medium]
TPTKKGERKDPQEFRPNSDYEISNAKEVQKENEVKSQIHVLESTIYKEEGTHANEAESLEASLINDSVQHESGTEEIKEPKNATYQEAKTSQLKRSRVKQQSGDEINRKSEENIDSLSPHLLDEQEDVLHVQEKNDKKEFHTPNIVEEERVLKKREGPMVAKNEETNNSSTLKKVSGKSKTKEENKPKMKEITTQFEKANGSKTVEEKVHETPKREHQRELEEVTSKIEVEPKTPIKEVERKVPLDLTSPPNTVNEILKVEEKLEEKEGQKHIQVLEATIAKGKDDRGHQYVQQKNNKKGFQTQKILEEEKVVKNMEEAKVAQSEETKDDYTFNGQDGKTTQASKFDKASSGSKRVGEKVHETSERNHQRELDEVTSKMRVEQPTTVVKTPTNMDNEIPRDTGSQQNSMVPKNLPPKRDFDSMEDTPTLEVAADKVVQQLEVPSTSCTQQFEVEGEEKAKKMESKIDVHESEKCKRGQEIEQCINNDEEAKQGIEEIKDEETDYEQVFEEQKEGEDETRGGKKDNAKISKEFFVPLVIAGSAILVTLIAIFVRHRRARKSNEAYKE